MRHKNILVLGGSGFVGRHLVARLVAGGRNVRVPTRRLARARPLTVLPTVQVLEADVMDPATLPRLLAGQDAMVNLVGVLHASSTQFQQVHVDFVRRVMEALVPEGLSVERLCRTAQHAARAREAAVCSAAW